ncbi:MAG: hypothetical protein JJ971_06780 [Balneolaceae bacterium]|nr:hypothetical protein [Balneolaceae bacterium]MBO6546079.1 hypothetical protein [Balneolaceae bacterium]MBO6647475.1 hypothetical protein [Balneolaceae bacterium]
MKTLAAFIFTISILVTSLTAQPLSGIHVETDPLTTVFGAKTVSLVFESEKVEHWSLFTNVVSADFPDWMDDFLNPKNKGKDFDTRIKLGGGLAIDYFFSPEKEGLYVGVINLAFNYQVQKDGSTEEILALNTIPRIGYRHFFAKNKNWYLNPFAGFRYESLFDKSKMISGSEFKPAGLQLFGTVHIGYKF